MIGPSASCPSLRDLPPPPPGRTGWPWTEASPQLPATLENGAPWPKISIVTPNHNYGRYLEETIRSVLLQGYPELEYIVLDAQSTDESLAIIERYARWLTYWVSEPDRGQAHAINKGFERVTGVVCNWLNSDDILMRGALRIVGEIFAAGEFDWITGGRLLKAENGVLQELQVQWLTQWPRYLLGAPDFPQEATFFSKRLWDRVGGLDEQLDCLLDVAFFHRALAVSQRGALTRFPIGAMNMHAGQKTLSRLDTRTEEHARLKPVMFRTPVARVVWRLYRSRLWSLTDAALLFALRHRASTYTLAVVDPVTGKLTLAPWRGML